MIKEYLKAGYPAMCILTEDDIPSPDNSKIDNINQLVMSANKYQDIKLLLNYTETFKDERSNDPKGVSLMTIHKSKGLEFPVVFVIGMVDDVLPNGCGELEEERRICFVAMSRAMDLLYLSHSHNHMGKSVKKSYFLN